MEKLAQDLIAGLSQLDACRSAVRSQNMQPVAMRNLAHVPMKNGGGRARIDKQLLEQE